MWFSCLDFFTILEVTNEFEVQAKIPDWGLTMIDGYDDFPEMNEILNLANEVAPHRSKLGVG